jgi:hypothetical protein
LTFAVAAANPSTDSPYFTAGAHLQDNRIERAGWWSKKDKSSLRIKGSFMAGTFKSSAGAVKVD